MQFDDAILAARARADGLGSEILAAFGEKFLELDARVANLGRDTQIQHAELLFTAEGLKTHVKGLRNRIGKLDEIVDDIDRKVFDINRRVPKASKKPKAPPPDDTDAERASR